MEALYRKCTLCPRKCGVDRVRGEHGFCRETAVTRIGCAGIHWGEEPVLTGKGGSGTIFFSGCTLQCPLCQNQQLSHEGMGARITQEELAQLCLRIEERGGCNINLVTGTQFAPAIVEAVTQARKAGLSIPVVWNSSGFETLETVSLLEQCVDIYLPDVKTIDATYAEELALPRSYPQSVAPAVEEMHRQKPLRYQDDVLRSGLIVRHLVYPELLENTKAVLTWYASTVEQGALLSVLAQFMPGDRDEETSIPKRSLTEEEYTTVISWLDELDIEEGFVQEYEPSGEWYPDFSTRAVFPSPQFELLWHWKDRI